jgi:hypothetical protein
MVNSLVNAAPQNGQKRPTGTRFRGTFSLVAGAGFEPATSGYEQAGRYPGPSLPVARACAGLS